MAGSTFCNPMRAQQTPRDTLPNIDITAQSHDAAPRHAQTTTAPVQTIGQKEIAHLGLRQVADALKLMSGITVRDYGGLGGMQTVSIRNLGAQHTGVLLDGVPVSNSQAGQIDISRFPTDAASRIELRIGQAQSLLSPASLESSSGVISLISEPKPKGFDTRLSYGSWNTIDAAVAQHGSKADIRAQYRHTDGKYPFTLTNGKLRTSERRNNGRMDDASIETNLRTAHTHTKLYYYLSERQLPGAIILYNTHNHETMGDRNALAQTRLHHSFASDFEVQALLKYNFSSTDYFDGTQINDGGITMHDYHYEQNDVLASLALRWKSISLTHDAQYNTLLTNIPETHFHHRWTTFTSFRAQYLRHWLTARAALLYTTVSGGHSRWTPQLSLNLRGPVSLRASWRKAFRLPSFNDLYYYRIGNRTLRPEKTDEWNLGITYRHAPRISSDSRYGIQWSATVDAYFNKVEDKIVAIPTTFAWRMYNYGKTHIRGIDFGIDLQQHWGDLALNLTANYNLQDAPLPYVARHSANASAILQTPWLTLGYSLQSIGQRYSSTTQTWRYRLAPFQEHNLTLSRTWKVCELSLTVQNLTDEQYQIIHYYPMPGRQFRATLRLPIHTS